ncbi:MAG TPA: hypothetical protein VGC19_11310 [Rhodanobacter sp.]
MNRNAWRLALPWLALLAFWLAVAWLRYGFIGSPEVAQLCDAGQPPAWCGVRHVLVLGFLYYIYGVAALAAAAFALFGKRMWLAWLAAALGALSLVLFCFEAGALALLIGCLRLLRLQQAARAPVEPYRQRDRQVQTQP